jgi:hypothetical protein
VLDEVVAALKAGDIRRIGAATTRNFTGPIQAIIPWATTQYTERLITKVRAQFGADFWGFWMLGGMSGGGMGFIFAPHRKAEGQAALAKIMRETKRELETALPFAMEPVVYDFAINERGTWTDLLAGNDALMPAGYYTLVVPQLLRTDTRTLPAARRAELELFSVKLAGKLPELLQRLLPQPKQEKAGQNLAGLLDEYGFDRVQHEQIRADLKAGRTGLAQNRLPATTAIEDVSDSSDVFDASDLSDADRQRGLAGLGEAAVVVLAAGVGSRWTQGAGVVKALHPFCKLGGQHRSFLEVHLAKARRIAPALPVIVTTSYLTHQQIAAAGLPVILSPGRAIGLRMVPMERDLRFAWEEMPHQLLDEQKQKVIESLHAALIGWARSAGEASDYTDNLPSQCLHPVGHWYEFANLLRNGTLAQLPNVRWLMLHNIDTAGAHLDPALLGRHIESGACLSFEVIRRRLEDRGGGLARVNGRVRLVEGLAMPREEDEFRLRYYNSMTTWIDVEKLLAVFGLTRSELADAGKVGGAIRNVAAKMPTYITLKDVKKRWGHGQEDIFPVAQFEKLWSDMTALPEVDCRFLVVPRLRGQQLKEQAQLDAWLRDGSAGYVESLCAW